MPISAILLSVKKLRLISLRIRVKFICWFGESPKRSTPKSCALRDNIFDLQAYLQKAGIAHSVAHPLYSINGKLEASHLERLILLFKHFEGINGLRDALLSDLAQRPSLRPDPTENRRVGEPP